MIDDGMSAENRDAVFATPAASRVATTVNPMRRRATWIRIEPAPQAPPVIRSVRGSTLGRVPRHPAEGQQNGTGIDPKSVHDRRAGVPR